MTDDERRELVLKVADHILETGDSTRATASVMGISNATVSDYINHRLRLINPDKYKKVREILEKNKPKTVNDEEVLERISKVAELFLKDVPVKEIASMLNISEMTVYRDLKKRLPSLSPIDKEKINNILKSHSMANLEYGREMSVPPEQRNFLGQFDKKSKL